MLKLIALVFAAVALAAPVCAEELSIAPGDQPITGHIVLTNGPSALIVPGPLDDLRVNQGMLSNPNGWNAPHLPPFSLNIATSSSTPFIVQRPWSSVLLGGRPFTTLVYPRATIYNFGFGFRR